MKKLLFLISFLFLITRFSYASPSNSISIPNSFTPNTTISSSEVNSNNNEIQTKYNAHSHSDITSLGTITTGNWNGTIIGTTYGGTGNNWSATTIGNIPYFSGTGIMTTLSPGTSGYILKSNGAAAPSWLSTLPVGNGGTGATAAANTANGVVVLDASGYVPNDSVDTTALKTTAGEVVCSANNTIFELPGGTYGFYPQSKRSAGSDTFEVQIAGIPGGTAASHTNYTTGVGIAVGGGVSVTFLQRYVTASGEDWWLMLLVEKSTGDIKGIYSAADHPSYGYGGDYVKHPHSFGDYDNTKYDIVLVDQNTIKNLQSETTDIDEYTGVKLLSQLVLDNYKVDYSEELTYVPLHSGKFLYANGNRTKQMVDTIPSYIKVRKLIKMTNEDKQAKETKRQEAQQKIDQDKAKKDNDKKEAIKKLKDLGLTEDEVACLLQ